MRLRILIFLASIAMLSACRTNPHKASTFYDRATFTGNQGELGITGEVIKNGRCYAWLTTPGSNSAPINFCTYMLTKDALFLFRWDANNAKYFPIIAVDFRVIDQAADSRSWGAHQVQFMQKNRLIAFQAAEDDGDGVARDDTKEVFEVVKAAGVRIGDSTGFVSAPPPPMTFVPIILGK
jgi:hypothetical protein